MTDKLSKVKMTFPPSMKPVVDEVLSGEYDLPLNIQHTIICDIGANVGSFAIWATHRWPGNTIHCFEPSPSTFKYLKKNLQPYKNVILHNAAVGNPKRTRLYQGLNSCAQASFFQLGEQKNEFELVTTVEPSNLPKKCDILKIDTEGCEIEILEGLRTRRYDVILVEYHSEDNRRKIDQLLKDYILVGSKSIKPNLGILKYINTIVLKKLLS